MSAGSGVVTPHAMASGGDGSGIWILYLRVGFELLNNLRNLKGKLFFSSAIWSFLDTFYFVVHLLRRNYE